MKGNKVISFAFLLVSTLLFIITIIFKIYSVFSYFFILLMIGFSILESQNRNIISSNFLFYMFFVYSVGFGPIVLLAKGVLYNYDYFKIILGGLLAFSWGCLLKKRYKAKEKIENKHQIKINIKREIVVRFLYFVSIIASIVYVVKNRSMFFGGNIQEGRVAAMSGNGIILYTMQLPIILVPVFYELCMIKTTGEKKIVSNIELISIIIISSVTLLLSGFRSPLISMYICLIFLYIKKNNKKLLSIIPYGIILIICTEVLGALRNTMSEQVMVGGIINKIVTNLSVNCINLNYIFNSFPIRVPFQHGYTYLINLLMLRPGPDLDFTLWLKEQLNLTYAGGGLTPTILGEFYINFGTISIYIGMFFWGIVGNKITEYFDSHPNSFLGAFLVWQFAHSVSGGIANVIIPVILFSLVYKFILMCPVEMRNINERE